MCRGAKGVNTMRAHLAHRDLMGRGDEGQLEEYYRTATPCRSARASSLSPR